MKYIIILHQHLFSTKSNKDVFVNMLFIIYILVLFIPNAYH